MSVFIDYNCNNVEHTVEISYKVYGKNSTLYKVDTSLPNVFNIPRNSTINLTVTCNGCNCLCKEFVRIFKSYPYMRLVMKYYAYCLNTYNKLACSLTSTLLLLSNVEVMNDYNNLLFTNVIIESCSFDPNFLVASRNIYSIKIYSCNIEFLLWCYVNLRYETLTPGVSFRYNSESFNKYFQASISVEAQICQYLSKKIKK